MLITLNKNRETVEFEYFDRYGTCDYQIKVDKHGAYEIELSNIYCELCHSDYCETYEMKEAEIEGLYYWVWEELASEGVFDWWQSIEDDWHNYGLENEKY